jgi:hypothetical protein
MERIKIISHLGKKILFSDFSYLQTKEEIAEIIREMKAYIKAQAPKSVYTLTSIEEMHFNNDIKDLFTEFTKSNKPYVRAGAVLGVSGLKLFIFNGIMKISGRDIKCFSSIEQAKSWLVGQN